MKDFGTNILRLVASATTIVAMMSWPIPARGDIVYQTNFDSLALGLTEPFPGAAGQDGWFQQLAVGDAFGEIQGGVANGGRALHQHTAATVPPALQTIDARDVGPVSLANIGTVSLSLDFYASSSNLSDVNNYIASFTVNGGPHPGFQIIGFGLGAGNGLPKSETGLNVGLAAFNGSNNNDPIPLTVGHNLSWDAWHSISISLDHHADTWLSITVDGQTQSLLGYQPVRTFAGACSEGIRGGSS